MKKQSQMSIWDTFLQMLPNSTIQKMKNTVVNQKAALTLYSIWSKGANNGSGKVYKKPYTLSKEEVNIMEKEGLVTAIGDNLEITKKGESVINTMILGDDRSIFEDDGSLIDYDKALKTTKGIKTSKNNIK